MELRVNDNDTEYEYNRVMVVEKAARSTEY